VKYNVTLGVMTWETMQIEAEDAKEGNKMGNRPYGL
jgi:hypothetical protein